MVDTEENVLKQPGRPGAHNTFCCNAFNKRQRTNIGSFDSDKE
jgi:hypothetical protein